MKKNHIKGIVYPFLTQHQRIFRIMKLFFAFLVICVSTAFATDAYSQSAKASVKVEGGHVKEVLKQIENQTDYLFVYNADKINLNRKVTIVATNERVSDILDKVFNETDVNYVLQGNNILLTNKEISPSVETALQQENKITVRGKVTDTSGEPLIGASIIEKGTSNGVVTDMNGEFDLHILSKEAVLEISYIGYSKTVVKVRAGVTAKIVLQEDTETLDEIVVVGYSTMKKEHLTSAVANVKGETLESRPVTKITQALQGAVANLNISSNNGGAPGATQSIDIRGYSGLGTTSSPLIVIDGIQGGDLNYINMDDVESISVLKDAASTAIYGSSAPFGAIIINTKKGNKDTKAKITYSNNFAFSQPINLPQMANSLDFANLYNEAADNAGIARPFTEENLQRIRDYQAGIIKDETIADLSGRNEWYTWTGNGNNDWFDIFFKDVSFSQQHNIGISGGTNKINYYVGLGYNQTGGMYKFGNDNYHRYNIRTNLSVNLTSWLSFNTRNTFTRASSDSPNTYSGKTGGSYMHQLGRKWPTAPVRNPNGEYSYPSDIRLMTEGGRAKATTDKAILTGEFVITPLKDWNITANYTYDGTYYENSDHTKTLYVTLPDGASTLYAGTSPNSFSRTTRKNQHHVINLFSSYEKQLSGHYFKALLGFTQELYDNLQLYSSNTYLYSDDIPAISLTYGSSPSTNDSASQLAIRGGFGSIDYNYEEKYLIKLNGRYDGTSRFMKDVRFKFYPGISAGWVISKEKFWKSMENIINSFKFRGSYGSLGNQSFTDSYYPFYPSMTTQAPANTNWLFSNGREAYVSYPNLINSDLTWVTTTTIDFGVDIALLNRKLNITFDWYKRKANDYVGPSEILPSIMGASSPSINNSSIETTGFDLSISWKDQIKDFKYSIDFMLSDYTGKVTEYPNPTGLNTNWYKGRKMGEIWGYETYGIFQTEEEIASVPSQTKIYANWHPGDVRYADIDGNGIIDWGDNTLENPGDRKIIGNTTPRYSFGLNLKADYKGFDFGLLLQGVAKRDAWLDTNLFWGITSGGQWQSSVLTSNLDRWTPESPNGYFPKYYLSGQMSKNTMAQTRYLQNAAYMRVKNLQVGYSFPKSLINKIILEKLRIFVSVDNLFTFSGMPKSIDPEFATSDGKIYPLQRTWSCGMNVVF